MNGKRIWSLGACLVIGMIIIGKPALADTEADLKARLDRAEARIAELAVRQDESNSWLSTQRAEEVKELVREVLADADARASLLEGSTAGHNGQHFFLSNDDGSFLLMMGGQIQVRHLYNKRDQSDPPDARDEHERGFEVARAKLNFWGHIAEPRIKYKISIGADRDDNEGLFNEVVLSYDLTDDMTIWAGETKAPFLREELTGSSRQLAVERSLVNEIFTMGTVQGIGLDWWVDKDSGNMVRVRTSINDGIRSGEADFNTFAGLHSEDGGTNDKEFDADNSDFAWTGRVDVRLMGDWAQGDDFTAWSDEETSVLLGAAVHWEWAETGDATPNNEFITWTVDGSIECHGANVYAAVVQSNDQHNEMGVEPTHTGVVAQAGYQILPDTLEPFVRYEYIHFGTGVLGTGDDLNLVTFGLNWYLNSHNAKVTTDVVWAFDSMPAAGTMGINGINQSLLGLLTDNAAEEDQVVWRAQVQLLF